MKPNYTVIRLKGTIAFGIPFLTTLGVALDPYVGAGSAQPTFVGWLVIICGPLVAGGSALKAFLSTDFSDHLDDVAGAPSAQVVAPAAVGSPVTK